MIEVGLVALGAAGMLLTLIGSLAWMVRDDNPRWEEMDQTRDVVRENTFLHQENARLRRELEGSK